MELLPSGELFEKQKKFVFDKDYKPMSGQYPLAATFLQIAKGVQSINDAGLAHRDLKEENIFCDETKVPPLVKVGDFGLSAYDRGRNRLSAIVGTRQTMAPEVRTRQYDK